MKRRDKVGDKAVKAQPPRTVGRRNAPNAARTAVPNIEERYRLVIEAVAEGIYEWSTETNHLELSTQLNEMFGFERGELTSASWLEHVHPDDRNRYRDATVAYFKKIVRHFACEYRVLDKSGQWRWVSDRASSIRDADGRVVRLIGAITDISELKSREAQLRESLQQQTATADMLKAISRSAFDLQTVLNTLVESVTRLCEADHAWLFQREGECFRWVAGYGHATDVHAQIRGYFMNRDVPVDRGSVTGRTALEGRVVHVPDVLADPEYTWSGAQKIGGYRAALGAPLLHKEKVVGVIFIVKTVPQPFTAKQIELATTFAAQAVIAIENTRLLNELRESLQQQTATADVLKVISSSPGELEPVFNTMLENATRICEAQLGVLMMFEAGAFHYVTSHGVTPAYAEAMRRDPVFHPSAGHPLDRLASTKQVIHIPDVRVEQGMRGRLVELAGARTLLSVPMLKDNKLVGTIAIYRQEVRPFTDKQIELVKNFAAQAVIAIENTRLLNELHQRTGDLSEALEQQTATSEVLKVISSSPGELEPVFEIMLANATQICGAEFGLLYRSEGDMFRTVSLYGAPPAFAEQRRLNPMLRPSSGTALGRVVATKEMVQIPDVQAEPAYQNDPLRRASFLDLAGARTVVCVPMLKDNEVVGAISIYRQQVRPFTDKQIALLTNFAAQAVIAIENTRLLNELRQRTGDLSESLEQQTATSAVLKVISSSPGELEPVFNATLENATRICDAKFGILWLYDDELFRVGAWHGVPTALADFHQRRGAFRPSSGTPLHRLLQTRDLVHSTDELSEPTPGAAARYGGARSLVAVPMRKENKLVGAFIIYRQEVRPFSDKQIELVKNFAAQAVIAIENTRLLNELRESLQQQTATADVLRVISSSPGNVEPVFRAMLEKATQICEAKFGVMFRFADGQFRATSWLENTPAYLIEHPHVVSEHPYNPLTRIASTKQPVHISDLTEERAYIEGNARIVALVEAAGARSLLVVPMVKNEELIGAIAIYWQEVRPFTEKQMELVENFAAQAVIAIENTRLLNELRESLQQQTATADVLKVISSSPGELEPVFATMLANATRLCDAKFGTLNLYDGDTFRIMAVHNVPPAFAETRLHELIRPHPRGGHAEVVRTKKVVQIEDIRAGQPYLEGDPAVVAVSDLGGARTIVAVPMLKEDVLVGTITIFRQEVRPFTDKQIELVRNFAAQAVIAIENARLLSELRESLQQQTATADVLKVISSSPGDLEPVFNAMLENATRICEAKFGVLFRSEGDAVRCVAMHGAPDPFVEERRRNPVIRPHPSTALARALATRRPVQIDDIQNETRPSDYTGAHLAKLAGARTVLAVPMLKDNELIGAIIIFRQDVRPFTDKQIELVRNFAAQAVIAIENTRLLNELRESLQQQTATADVLKVISRSTFDLQTVLDTLVESAARLCGAEMANIWRPKDGAYRLTASFGVTARYKEYLENKEILSTVAIEPGRGTMVGRVLLEKKTVHMHDIQADPDYKLSALVAAGGYRTMLGVPMLRQREPIGVLVLVQSAVRPFTDKQIDLATTFADQAVIAIENVRLFDEVQARTRDLAESLQQQTATADVLKSISRSAFDLKTVLDALVEAAARLCEADQGTIARERDGVYQRVATYGFSDAFKELVRNLPVSPERGTATGRALLEGKVVHIPDVRVDPEYTFVEAQKLGDFRTVLSVPMLREGTPIGVLTLTRHEVRPFTDKQIELVTTFADQAAIAIENVRLFESVEARTRELAASLEDLRTTQDRLVQTQKLASLGQLTAGIAHEIKNPLNFVNNFSGVSAELIDELRNTLKGPLDDKARAEINELTDTLRSNLDKVVQHGKRADAIVKNMLLHSREGSGEHRPVDINALVEESLNLAYHGARAEKQGFNITLQRSFDPKAGEADVFPQDITRVLLNLISNGFYAATKRRAETNGGDYEPTLAAATKNLGDRVGITIRDNGTGILPDVKEKIFNPFFTTKPAGEGTGLGLSISHDIIVKQHGGSIEVDTQPGEFTEVKIILPRAAVFLAESRGGV